MCVYKRESGRLYALFQMARIHPEEKWPSNVVVYDSAVETLNALRDTKKT